MLVTPKLKVFNSILLATVVKNPTGSLVFKVVLAEALNNIASERNNDPKKGSSLNLKKRRCPTRCNLLLTESGRDAVNSLPQVFTF